MRNILHEQVFPILHEQVFPILHEWGLPILSGILIVVNLWMNWPNLPINLLVWAAFACLFLEIVIQNVMIFRTRNSHPVLVYEENGYGTGEFPVTLVTDGDIAHGSTGNEIELRFELGLKFRTIPKENMKYLWIDIYNHPKDNENGITAENVCALIQFEGGHEYYGRWDTRLVSPFSLEIPRYVNIHPYSRPERLKIALKSKDEESFYGWSELSYEDAFWKSKELEMGGREYKVTVKLMANKMKPIIYSFLIKNEKGDFSICPANQRKQNSNPKNN